VPLLIVSTFVLAVLGLRGGLARVTEFHGPSGAELSPAVQPFRSRAAAPLLLIESLGGPVTAPEIAAFRAHLATVPLPSDSFGNAMVYGAAAPAHFFSR
jgi:hypothetical protein